MEIRGICIVKSFVKLPLFHCSLCLNVINDVKFFMFFRFKSIEYPNASIYRISIQISNSQVKQK